MKQFRFGALVIVTIFTLTLLPTSMSAKKIIITADAGCTVEVQSEKLGSEWIAFDATATASARLAAQWQGNTELRQKLRAFHSGSTFTEALARAAGLFASCNEGATYDVVICSPWVGYQAFQDIDGNYGYVKSVISGNDTSQIVVYLHPGRDWLAPLVSGEQVWIREWKPFNRVSQKIRGEEASRVQIPCDTLYVSTPDSVTIDCPEPPQLTLLDTVYVHDTTYVDTCFEERFDDPVDDGSGDNLRLGFDQGTFYDIMVITDCDTIRETGHTAGGDTLLRDFRLHCGSQSRESDTVFLHEERGFQAEFRPMIELGQLTKAQFRFGGAVTVSRRFSVAAHGGVQVAPHVLDYGMRGSQFEDTLWSRGFYGFLGDIEAIYSLRPEKGFNPQLVLGVQGEFGTTELSGDRKSPSNQFSPIDRVNISPYTQLRLEFGEVAIFAGWNLFPADYFNRWEANPDGGDRWWGGVKKPDLNFGLNVKF